jgi:hypothetical protein
MSNSGIHNVLPFSRLEEGSVPDVYNCQPGSDQVAPVFGPPLYSLCKIADLKRHRLCLRTLSGLTGPPG